jgi:exosome complex RNA-binding protein Rrp42 (RNase PH superfamily)
MGVRLSASERSFIEAGISKGIRGDGRALQSLRSLRLTLGELPGAHGSARVSLGGGLTEVLATVKAELVNLAEGSVAGVECSAHVLAGGGEGGDAGDARREAECGGELAAALQEALGAPGVVPGAALEVVAQRWGWRLAVDALVVASDGAVVEAALLAAHAALRCARLPCLRVARGSEAAAAAAAAGAAAGGAPVELELNDDPGAARALPLEATLPLCVSLHAVRGVALLDASGEEEACAASRVRVGLNRGGDVCFLDSSGREGAPPADLGVALGVAKAVIPALFAQLDAALEAPLEGLVVAE